MPQPARILAMPQQHTTVAAPISQERLRLGMELMRKEWAAIQERQNYLRELMADLAAGGIVEAGELDLNLANGMILPRQEPRLAPVLAMKTKG